MIIVHTLCTHRKRTSKKTLNYFLEIWIHKCCTKKLSTFYAHVLKSKILDFGGSPVSQKDVPRKSFERNVVLERNLGGYYMRNFSHGLKFQPALQGEILLWLHGKFQPRFKHNFSIAAILFRWIFRQCACSNSRFNPGLNFTAITWGFSAFQPGLKILARFLKWGKDFQPGLNVSPSRNLLHVIVTFISRGFLSEPRMKSQPG